MSPYSGAIFAAVLTSCRPGQCCRTSALDFGDVFFIREGPVRNISRYATVSCLGNEPNITRRNHCISYGHHSELLHITEAGESCM